MSNIDDLPLPYGWVKQEHQGHPFYVDTKANPPRSIWTHPYEDEQYLNEHPEARDKARPVSSQGYTQSAPNSTRRDDNRRHSYNGQSSQRSGQKQKRGFFGKIKDKAIGTKEEREAEKARAAQRRQQRFEQEQAYRQQRLAQEQAYHQQRLAQQQAYPQQAYPQQYAAPYGSPYGSGMTGLGGGRRTGGMGGMALPLVGGLAGGLLLGDVLGGGFGGDGGDFGGDGGGFGGDGGDFGGGGGDFGGDGGGGF